MINFVCVCFRGAGWAALKYSIARRVGLQKTLVGCSRLLTSEMLLARGSPSSTAVVVDFDMALVQVAQGRHLSYLGKTPLQLLVEQVRSDIVVLGKSRVVDGSWAEVLGVSVRQTWRLGAQRPAWCCCLPRISSQSRDLSEATDRIEGSHSGSRTQGQRRPQAVGEGYIRHWREEEGGRGGGHST